MYTTLLHTFPGILLILAALNFLVFKRDINHMQRYLIVIGLLLGISEICYAAIGVVYPERMAQLNAIYFICDLGLLISYFVYIRLLISPDGQLLPSDRWFVYLSLFISIAYWLGMFHLTYTERHDLFHHFLVDGQSTLYTPNHLFYYLYRSFFIEGTRIVIPIVWVVVIVWGEIKMLRMRRMVKEFVTETPKHLNISIHLVSVMAVLIFAQFILDEMINLDAWVWIQWIYLFIKLSVVGVICYLIANFDFSFSNMEQLVVAFKHPDAVVAQESSTENGTNDEQERKQANMQAQQTPTQVAFAASEPPTAASNTIDARRQRLEQAIANRFYTDATITMPSLAALTEMSIVQLRESIRHMGYSSFSIMVHQLRCEEAHRILLEHPEMSKKEVATLVGYADLSTFLSHFE